MNYRPFCPICDDRPVAVNCRKGDKVYYRKLCDPCSRKGKKLKPAAPQWYRFGYRKKPHCDKCGFKARYNKQLIVFHVDGNLSNVDEFNLRTICANCKIELQESKTQWKSSTNIGNF